MFLALPDPADAPFLLQCHLCPRAFALPVNVCAFFLLGTFPFYAKVVFLQLQISFQAQKFATRRFRHCREGAAGRIATGNAERATN